MRYLKREVGIMINRNKRSNRSMGFFNSSALTLSLVLPFFCGAQALAQDATSALSPDTVKLVTFLVEKGVLSKAQATEFAQKMSREKAAAASPVAASPAAAANTSAAAAVPTSEAVVRVPYIPETVRKQIKAELRQEVMAQAKDEHWAAPDEMPAWTKHLRLSGDLRLRYEGDLFPSGNDSSGSFPNFNAINTGSPYDTSSTSNHNYPSEYNVDQDRHRFRLRARFGIDADLGEAFTAGIRIATGDSNTPVSTNQSIGASGGNFSKYSIWLDRAWLRYAPIDNPRGSFAVTLGRFENPFYSTELVFDDDLNFDGVAIQASAAVTKTLKPFVTVGAFPVFSTDFNFASNQPAKYKSDDKYLFAAQGGFDWTPWRNASLKFAAAYYDFDNVRGRLSSACTILSSADVCDTDATRPSFAQKGNTYRPLRLITSTSANNFGTTNLYQYYGLATGFRELAITGSADLANFEPVHLLFEGEAVKNLAFDKSAVDAVAVNNRGAVTKTNANGPFEGGDLGYLGRFTVGYSKLENRGDWNLSVAYKYLESDAVIDGLADSDFGLGGTNLKGFIVGGGLALSSHVSAGLRWMSADAIGGPKYGVDVVQFDIKTRF
ncbi:putative porin [Rhizomicrobium palustre]|nr:putative porin [Rhizomicrobium palustre]